MRVVQILGITDLCIIYRLTQICTPAYEYRPWISSIHLGEAEKAKPADFSSINRHYSHINNFSLSFRMPDLPTIGQIVASYS